MGTAMYRLYEAGLALELIIIVIMLIAYIKSRNSRIITILIILTILTGIDIAPLVFNYSPFILNDYISSIIKWLSRNEWQMYGYRQGVSAVELIIVVTVFMVFLTFMILVGRLEDKKSRILKAFLITIAILAGLDFVITFYY